LTPTATAGSAGRSSGRASAAGGAWFAGLRARFAVRRADKNRNGAVDDEEVEHLIELAEREVGFIITADPVPPPAVTSASGSRNREYIKY
jgi:hypothetical protein